MKSSTYYFHMKTKILFLTGLVIQLKSLPSHVTTISKGMKFGRGRPEVFCRKGALRNFAKLTGKNLCQSLFFNKVAGLKPETLLKRRLWHRYFPVKFTKFLRTPFLWNTSGRLLLEVANNIQYNFVKSNTFLLTSTQRKAFSKSKFFKCPLNAIRIRKFMMPHCSFIGWWMKNI